MFWFKCKLPVSPRERVRAGVGKEWELRSQQKCAVVSGGASGASHSSLKKAFSAVCEEFSKSYYNTRMIFTWLVFTQVLAKYHTRVYWVWLRWSSFSLSSPQGAVLCIGTQKGAGNTPVFWLLLGRAGAASALALNILPPARDCEWARSWEGTQPGQQTQINQREIPCHVMSAQM